MKKLHNGTGRMVDDMIEGLVAAFPGLVARGAHPRVVRRARRGDGARKTALVIGNGSGHEPIAIGFVGEGMLDANVAGDVFTAPPAEMILEGLREVTGPAGAILLISRHEGDVIAGREAALMAADEGLDVRPLLMYDDISSAPAGQEADRRGAAGTLFVYKILGAAAEEGMAAGDLLSLGEAVRDATRTLAVAIAPGISPITGQPMFTLPEGEVFIGMGVHGEPGAGRRPLGSAEELVGEMVEMLLADRPVPAGTPVAVLVNGAGGCTRMELWTVYREAARALEARGIPAVSPVVGSLSTTQATAGFSISLLTPTEEMLRLWRAPQHTPAFPAVFAAPEG